MKHPKYNIVVFKGGISFTIQYFICNKKLEMIYEYFSYLLNKNSIIY